VIPPEAVAPEPGVAEDGRSAGPGALPTLIVIGAQKCGTSSLHRYLDAHPAIAMSRVKELDFFLDDGNWSRGVEWYRSQFDSAARVCGESSPNYTNLPVSRAVAERMHDIAADARLIYMVRDPIERALSHYTHAVGLGREDRPVDVAMSEPDSRYLRRSLYRTQLEPFVSRFPEGRIHVATQEDLRDRRGETLREIFEFVGVDTEFSSQDFDREWEVSAGKDRKFKLAYRASRLIGGKSFWGRLPPAVRWRLERLALGRVGEPVQAPQPADSVRAGLVDRLRPEIAWLRAFTGRDFAGWGV